MNDLSPTAANPIPSAPAVNGPAKRALFVDDDKFLLDMYALKFAKAGYEVKTADSAEAAAKVIAGGFMPDAMMVDVVMPGMDGLDFAASIRPKLAPQTAVIMLTNQGASDDIARAKKIGVDGYIVKATSIPSEVLAEVEKVMATKKE